MKTLNRKNLMILAVICAVAMARWLMVSNDATQLTSDHPVAPIEQKTRVVSELPEPVTAKLKPEPAKHHATMPQAIKAETREPVVVSSSIYIEPVTILKETYVQEEILDETWDEEAYIEEQRALMETMTEEELAAREQLNQLEGQLMLADDDVAEDETVLTQLQELFDHNDLDVDGIDDQQQSSHQLLDIRCSSNVCRVALQLPDEASQYEVLDTLPEQLEWLEQSYADVTVKPDDNRIVTVYLTRADRQDEAKVY